MDEIFTCVAAGLRRTEIGSVTDECIIMVIGDYLVVGRRTKRGDGDFGFKYTIDDNVDPAAAYRAASDLVKKLRGEGLILVESSKMREIEEHPDYVRRWVDGVRSGRKDELELYSVFTRMVAGLAPLARVTA